MCGIVGVIGADVHPDEILDGLRVLRHRGPDGQGLWVDPSNRVGLGHARLAITSPRDGAQPLRLAAHDLVLVCNGELYGHRAIRRELEARGHEFHTGSDCEILIHLYREYGLGLFEHVRGEFAFLLYDAAKERLIAARDRFGVRPLFFAETESGYAFGSEAKAIFGTGRVAPRLDPVAIRDAMSLVLPSSIFEGVRQVPPGSFMVFDKARAPWSQRYWAPDLDGRAGSDERSGDEWAAEVAERLDDAVAVRLDTEARVGVYLSGGIDSAAVAASAAAVSGAPLVAFTLSFQGDGAYDELSRAREMATHLGAELHEVPADESTLLRLLESYTWHAETMFGNLHGVAKYLLASRASRKVRVVLTGEGSDEVFLGYDFYRLGEDVGVGTALGVRRRRRNRASRTGRWIRRLLGFVPMQDLERSLSAAYQGVLTWLFRTRHRDQLRETSPLARIVASLESDQLEGRPELTKVQYYSWKRFLEPYNLPLLGDRPEMAHGLESRVPMLDHRLVELAARIPNEWKLRHGDEKHVLRRAVRHRVTLGARETPKWPFVAPPVEVSTGRSDEMDVLLRAYLSPASVRRTGVFRWQAVQLLLWCGRWTRPFRRVHVGLHALLLSILTLHILDAQFREAFSERSRRRARVPRRAAIHPWVEAMTGIAS